MRFTCNNWTQWDSYRYHRAQLENIVHANQINRSIKSEITGLWYDRVNNTDQMGARRSSRLRAVALRR